MGMRKDNDGWQAIPAPRLDPTRALTKRKILEALADVPLDEPILVNVELPNEDNYDTWHSVMLNMSTLCPGYQGCTHTEPEMDWDLVLHVKFGDKPGIMEPVTQDEEKPEC